MTGRIVDSETVFRYERECACERVNFPGQGSLAVNWPVVAHPHPTHPRRTHTHNFSHTNSNFQSYTMTRGHTDITNIPTPYIHMYIYVHIYIYIHRPTDLHEICHHICADMTYTHSSHICIHHNYSTYAQLSYIHNIPYWSPTLQPPPLLVAAAT